MKIFKKIVDIAVRFVARMGVTFMLTILIMNAAAAGNRQSFSPDYFGVAALFAALIALCGVVLDVKFIPSELAKGAIHVVLATASFIAAFVLASGVKTTASAAFVMAVIFAVADAAVLIARGFYLRAVKKADTKEKNEEPKEAKEDK